MLVPGCEVCAWRKLRSHCPRPRDKLSCPSTQSRESEDGLRVGGDSKSYYLAFQRIPNSGCVWYFRKTHSGKASTYWVHQSSLEEEWTTIRLKSGLRLWFWPLGPGNPRFWHKDSMMVPSVLWWYQVSYNGTQVSYDGAKSDAIMPVPFASS